MPLNSDLANFTTQQRFGNPIIPSCLAAHYDWRSIIIIFIVIIIIIIIFYLLFYFYEVLIG